MRHLSYVLAVAVAGLVIFGCVQIVVNALVRINHPEPTTCFDTPTGPRPQPTLMV